MRVLVINGSPRGTKSNTMRVTDAFVSGMREAGAAVQTVHLATQNIEPCRGCFSCWSHTPGKCVIRDDVHSIAVKLFAADVIIWSFPLYFYGLPALVKAMIERQIPFTTPFMSGQTDWMVNGGHPPRFDVKDKRYMLISTCGFYPTSRNYDGIRGQFDMIYGPGGYDTLFMGEGELFSKPHGKRRCDLRLSKVKTAGRDYVEKSLSETERAALWTDIQSDLFPPNTYAAMSDMGWSGCTIESYAQNDADVREEIEREKRAWANEEDRNE